jgi:hypothetical protein
VCGVRNVSRSHHYSRVGEGLCVERRTHLPWRLVGALTVFQPLCMCSVTWQVAGSSINVARMLRYAGVDPYAPPQPQHQHHRDRQQVPDVPLDTGRVAGGGGRADDATWDDSVAEVSTLMSTTFCASPVV